MPKDEPKPKKKEAKVTKAEDKPEEKKEPVKEEVKWEEKHPDEEIKSEPTKINDISESDDKKSEKKTPAKPKKWKESVIPRDDNGLYLVNVVILGIYQWDDGQLKSVLVGIHDDETNTYIPLGKCHVGLPKQLKHKLSTEFEF